MPAHSALTLPPLPYADWVETKETLHLFLQIIGKIRMKTHPKLNHWWHVTLYPATSGLTTGRIPCGDMGFEIFFDMIDHSVRVRRDDGLMENFDVPGKSVAQFYDALFTALNTLGISVKIVGLPYENKSTIPFAEDMVHKTYDAEAVTRYWAALCRISVIFERFRSRFTGKQTPVHLYWHSFDLAVTRFSGRAHPLEGGTVSDREAYSHEVISFGFWPGDDSFPEPAFYAYAYPEPEGLPSVPLKPPAAFWTEKNGGSLAILKYDDLRHAPQPADSLLAFLQAVYDGAAKKADWNVAALEHAFSS